MYSLVSAPVLGYDLTRLGGGAATAEVLLRALCLREGDLSVLAAQLPNDGLRAELWLEVDEAATKVPTLRGVVDMNDPAGSLSLIERTPIGSLDGLLHCVRHDVLSWTWTGAGEAAGQDETASRATALLCDAVVATYLRDQLSEQTRRRLGAGWVAAMRRLPAPAPINLGPHHYAVSAMLERLSAVSAADANRLEAAAADSRRHPGGWPSAVHSASWAAYLSDRVRTAATAQLLLVQAMDTGAIPLAARAAGVWNLMSGAVQALVVRDLLDTTTAHRLIAPVVSALGPAWLMESG